MRYELLTLAQLTLNRWPIARDNRKEILQYVKDDVRQAMLLQCREFAAAHKK